MITLNRVAVRMLVMSVFAVSLLGAGGCANPSMTITNSTDLPVHVEVAIGSHHKFSGRNQNYRFRLAAGESWHSRHAERDHRVKWETADGVHTGILVRSRDMDVEDSLVYHLSLFKHAYVTIAGHWPNVEVIAVDETGGSICILERNR